jgi:protein-disulfide isomerase
MPEGMTKDQADAILNELKAIHQLLLNPPATRTAVAAPAVPPSDKVKMSVGTGWYALGRDDAPVTVVEFTDYQCPFCRRFETDTFAQLKKDYIDTGKVRFVSRDLPLDFHPNAPAAAMAARCAGEQHKFWEMRDAMMLDTATDLGPDSILKYGQKTNLDMTAFGGCLKDKKYTSAIQKDAADAGALGISGTPSFVIGKTAKDEIAGIRIVGAVPFAVFDSTIKDLLLSK